MIVKKHVINNINEVHALYAARIVKKIKEFESEVFIRKNGKTINCRSIVSLLNLGIRRGDTIDIMIDGIDEVYAADEMIKFINSFED